MCNCFRVIVPHLLCPLVLCWLQQLLYNMKSFHKTIVPRILQSVFPKIENTNVWTELKIKKYTVFTLLHLVNILSMTDACTASIKSLWIWEYVFNDQSSLSVCLFPDTVRKTEALSDILGIGGCSNGDKTHKPDYTMLSPSFRRVSAQCCILHQCWDNR